MHTLLLENQILRSLLGGRASDAYLVGMPRKDIETESLLRAYLREAMQPMFSSQKMSFEDLSDMQDKLDRMVVSGKIQALDYNDRWADVLAVAGWAQAQYDAERDRRWDYIDSERELPVKRRYAN